MRSAVVFVVLGLAAACGDEAPPSEFTPTVTQGSGGSVMKHAPAPNGEYIGEAEACEQLLSAFQSQKSKVCGPGTDPICPQFLRTQYQTQCMFYDAGSVQGCIDYYGTLNQCMDLVADECLLTTYPETAPAGCP